MLHNVIRKVYLIMFYSLGIQIYKYIDIYINLCIYFLMKLHAYIYDSSMESLFTIKQRIHSPIITIVSE